MLAALNILSPNSDAILYTAPTSLTRTTFLLSLCNRSASAVTVRVALCQPNTAPAPDGSNYIECDSLIPANSTLERVALVLKAGQVIFVRSNTPNAVSAVIYGIEE